MNTHWQDFSLDLTKSRVFREHGWERRVHNRCGHRTVQWKHPDTGLWHNEPTAMRILGLGHIARP